MEAGERRTRVTRGASRRLLGAMRAVRTMARRASGRDVGVLRLRFVVVAARAGPVRAERARVSVVTARARRVTARRRLRLDAVAASTGGLRER